MRAGDIGHIIVEPSGPRCPCGARGCLEALVSAPALERATGRLAREAIDLALAGDAGARAALGRMGWWLGLGIASLVSIFAPDRITIGGGIMAAGNLLLRPAGEAFRANAAPHFSEGVELVPASLGPKAGLIGAACALLDKVAVRG
jgi:glucokinase